ncbi:hypothetical protein [Secundilactobacillus collinoides]|uniref:Uncharacterized protein n=2 Tax=Secundilactobacillus collinoides TaxID=33960 RepID=A0A0R2B5V8_SECCO|nr:hypothetical protein [Secundilactobacillus collinoides]KRM74877.1 hypothetical protein FC82_GL002821 [Secundilactobacillus collinoides DSM 20515 = JCM 1123]KZL39373.1 hypothetical protein TY91_10230 [Secundilactobacillus collinoides]
MADHIFDDHSATIASTTLLKALNDAASTKDFDPDLKKQFAIALSAVFNDETVKRSLARIAVQEIDYLRDTDPEKHLPEHHTRESITKLD